MQKLQTTLSIYLIDGIDDHKEMPWLWWVCGLRPFPRFNKEALELSADVVMDGVKLSRIMQSFRECFASESQVIYDGTNDAICESHLLKLVRAEEVASQNDRVISITSKLETTGNGVGNGALPWSSQTEEPVDSQAFWWGIIGPSCDVA
jgi:hypothetical protein